MERNNANESGKHWVFCRYIIDKLGRRIYPKHAKCIAFLVDSEE